MSTKKGAVRRRTQRHDGEFSGRKKGRVPGRHAWANRLPTHGPPGTALKLESVLGNEEKHGSTTRIKGSGIALDVQSVLMDINGPEPNSQGTSWVG